MSDVNFSDLVYVLSEEVEKDPGFAGRTEWLEIAQKLSNEQTDHDFLEEGQLEEKTPSDEVTFLVHVGELINQSRWEEAEEALHAC